MVMIFENSTALEVWQAEDGEDHDFLVEVELPDFQHVKKVSSK